MSAESPTRCRVCEGTAVSGRFRVAGLEVMRCAACSHVYLGRHFDREELRRRYAGYGGSDERPGGTAVYFRSGREELAANLRGYLCTALSLAPRRERSARLLDVGCGNGVLLACARDLGCEIEGVELSPALARHVSDRLGCVVHPGFLEDADLRPRSYDIVTMYDVLEHLEAPRRDLEMVRRLLAPGGILFVLTPNEHALVRRVAKLLWTWSLGIYRRPMEVLYYADHLSYFTSSSLRLLLESCGFRVTRHETGNPEISRLDLPRWQKLATRCLFVLSRRLPRAGGKHLVWATVRGVPVPESASNGP